MSGNRATANRGDHLRNLARVFRRRGCDWADFGQFLNWLFYDQESRHRLSNLNCRHDPQGTSHSYNGSLPCTTTGVRDKGKAMKFVSFDLRILAREWCADNGFNLLEVADRDVRHSPAFHAGGGDSSTDDDFIDSASAGDDDTWAFRMGLGMSRFSSSSPLRSSQEEERRLTGLRVHVLAFLSNFWDDPVQLEMHWELLVTTQEPLLHLCGCGICHDQDRACTEPSHLRLGTRQVNDYQTAWHQALTVTADDAEYQSLVAFFNGKTGYRRW
jgi:hypothetical protein